MKKAVIIIVGPTAVGKTGVAIQLAKFFKTEIISADSRQCFKELNTGVARPAAHDLEEVKHHFIASHSIHDDVNASVFEKFALQKTGELLKSHEIVIMVGGTGLYVKAFSEGLDEIPGVKKELREQIIHDYEKNGLEWLQEQVRSQDPDYCVKGEMQNPQRLMRALEVKQSTGHSILDFRKPEKASRDFNVIKIGLHLPKEELHARINKRTDEMIRNGLVQEVEGLLPYKNLNALQTVGYSEIFEFLEGKLALHDAIEEIKKNTRQYAKRQMTWFKKDNSVTWFAPGDFDAMLRHLDTLLTRA